MKVGVIVPYQEMAEVAKPILEEKNVDVVYFKLTDVSESVNEARKAIEAGAEVIISRGYQAYLIKEYTRIPVVELRIHSQEIGLQIKRAKQIINKERPHIGLVTYGDVLCDMSFMGELFDVQLDVVRFEKMEMVPSVVQKLIKNGVDIIIGGERCMQAAQMFGCPALVYKTSAEAVLEAIREVERISYATEIENQNRAQFETVLDNAFNGIIKINMEAQIIVINKLIEHIIGRTMDEVVGEPIEKIIPEIDLDVIQKVLSGKYDNYTVSITLKKQPWLLLIAPIQYENKITGAILSLQGIKEKIGRNKNQIKDMYLHGYVAETLFSDIKTSDSQMRHQIEKAKKYALSDRPVVIYAEEGTEYHMISEAIHNNSSRKEGPYVSVNLNSVPAEKQIELLFGSVDEEKTGAFSKAMYGTLFIKNLDCADLQVQNQIAKQLISRTITKTDLDNPGNYDVRIIASTKNKLHSLMKTGEFSEELFYLIQGFTIEVPSLRERKEDLLQFFLEVFKEMNEKYGKYLVLTQGAQKKVQNLEWPGNQMQIRTFCETLVLISDHRSVDEVMIKKLYDQLYPKTILKDGREQYVVYRSPEEEQLMQLLEKHHGNRKLIAEELGISVTTLWRRMKKYGIEE